MHLLHESVKYQFDKEPSAGPLVAAQMYMSLALGVILIVGGAKRITSPAFMFITQTVDWSPFDPNITWGVIFLGSVVFQGICLYTGLKHFVFALRISAIPYAIWTLLFAQAAVTPTASLTGIVMYSMGFIIILTIASVVAETAKEKEEKLEKKLLDIIFSEAERQVTDERTSVAEPKSDTT